MSISKSVFVDESAAASAKRAARTRFVPLLIINDVLHADKFHPRGAAKSGTFGKEFMAYVPELVELAAAYIPEKDSQNEKKLRALVNFWALNHLFDADDIKTLRDRADEGLLVAQGGTPVRRRHYLLPEYHGDRNAPWHALPAAYMLEPLIRYPDLPIDYRHIKIAKLDKKPVSPYVRGLLDDFFENIDLKYKPTGDNPKGATKKHDLCLDPMGQIVKKDKETGEQSTVCNGYGWSMKLCQDMQKDGLPENIKLAREEARREDQMELLRPAPQQRKSGRRYSPSPHRRGSISSDSDSWRGRNRRSGSDSRPSSRSSYDSRQNSRSERRDRPRGRRRTSPQPDRMSRGRGQNYNDRGGDRQRPSPRPYNKGDASGSGRQRGGPDASNRGRGISHHGQYASSSQHAGQGFSQAPQPPSSAPSFPPPPPMPGQFPGQFPMQPFPPGPFQPGAFPGGVPPPPPPNYSGPIPPPPPNMTAMPNNPYNFGGNQPGNNGYGNNNAGYGQNPGGNQSGNNSYGNNAGYGQNASYGQTQGNFQGGRGGFRGNNQSGGYNNRGGYGGQQRGQRGQRGGW